MSALQQNGAQAALLPDGRRLHLHHGPIDLIIEAWGDAEEIARAYRQAEAAFAPVLTDLVDELVSLRTPVDQLRGELKGPVAQRMVQAVKSHCDTFVTPMAAVAGAVADDILAKMVAGRRLERAYVNNGGDIALHIASGEMRIAIATDTGRARRAGTVTLSPGDVVRGIATSGWRGRSHSLGIADAVTVLARTAAAADVAATLIANAVDLPGSPKIEREPANACAPDSDLGARLVTVDVARLSRAEGAAALDRGAAAAQVMIDDDRIEAAFLCLQGETRTLGWRNEGQTGIATTLPAGLLAAADPHAQRHVEQG